MRCGARDAARRRLPQFVPGHPIAGNEHSGAEAGDPSLYVGRQVDPDAAARNVAGRGRARRRISGRPAARASRGSTRRGTTRSSPRCRTCRTCSRSRSSPSSRRARTRAELLRQCAASGFRDFTRIAGELAGDVARHRARQPRRAARRARRVSAALDALARRCWRARDRRGARSGVRQCAARRAAQWIAAIEPRRGAAPRRTHASAPQHDHSERTYPRRSRPRAGRARRRHRCAARLEEHLQPHAAAGGAGERHDDARGLLDADDTRACWTRCARSASRIERTPDDALAWCTARAARSRSRAPTLFLGNAGTAVRPLTAALRVLGGDYALAGVPRMHERPIGDLVDALRALGADIRYAGKRRLSAAAIGAGGVARRAACRDARRRVEPVPVRAADGAAAAPRRASRDHGRRRRRADLASPTSRSRLNLMRALRRRGRARRAGGRSPCPPAPATGARARSHVEGDASAALVLPRRGRDRRRPGARDWRGPRLDPGRRRVRRRARAAWAPTSATAPTGSRRGAAARSHGGTIDCIADSRRRDDARDRRAVRDGADTPRQHRQLARQGNRSHRGDGNRACASSARRLRRAATGSSVAPLAHFRQAAIDTYDDHRMAMCFSLAALGGTGVTINDPGCVRKTFPGYFDGTSRSCDMAEPATPRRPTRRSSRSTGRPHPARARSPGASRARSAFTISTADRCTGWSRCRRSSARSTPTEAAHALVELARRPRRLLSRGPGDARRPRRRRCAAEPRRCRRLRRRSRSTRRCAMR